MDFYDVVDARRTIRDFKDVQIDDETITRIIGAGMKAPTNDHMRDWHFIVLKDKSVTMKLLEAIPARQPTGYVDAILRDWNLTDSCQQAAYKNAIPKQHKMLLDASALIVPLFRQNTDILHPENLSHLNGFASIWCCIENILLASTAEGFTCTLRIPLGNEGEWSREILNYPNEYLAPCFIGIGKPKDDAHINTQKIYNLDERIHTDRW